MDQRRLILLLVFSLSLVMLWDGWIKHNQPAVPAPVAGAAAPAAAGSSVPTPSAGLTPGATALPSAEAAKAAPKMRVVTDMLRADISAEGGSIVRLELAQHKDTNDRERNFVLLDDGMRHLYSAESGLIGDGLPNHRTVYALPADEVALKDGEDTLVLRLEAPEQNGVKVTKLMTFRRGSYLVDVSYEINNGGAEPLSAHAYFQLTRDGKPAEDRKSVV